MAAAISNALHDAVGVRLHRPPFTPERVWRALQERRGTDSVASGGGRRSADMEPAEDLGEHALRR
jgi:hypothetical protein